jgi:hypothetical protein
MTITQFDNVRINDTPLTRESGFAGERGVVYGFTTPSATGISFLGTSAQDIALNVYFEHRKADFWFAPELIEFVDHNAGCVVEIGGRKMVRRSNGEWDEIGTPD